MYHNFEVMYFPLKINIIYHFVRGFFFVLCIQFKVILSVLHTKTLKVTSRHGLATPSIIFYAIVICQTIQTHVYVHT